MDFNDKAAVNLEKASKWRPLSPLIQLQLTASRMTHSSS